MSSPILFLKKNEDKRIRAGHLWVFSNEIDIAKTPLKSFATGDEVAVYSHTNQFLGMAYVNPHSLIAARIYSHDLNEPLNLAYFKKRITTALALRIQLFTEAYYRMIFGESDYLPGLVVDRFNDILIVQINTAGMEKQTEHIIAALLAVLPETQGILLRNDSPSRIQEGLDLWVRPAFGAFPAEISMEENNTHFLIPTLEGQKTGWFYDHRYNRKRLIDYVKDKQVLDVFSYLGGWGIQAARLGAKEVYCLDSSPLSETWIPKNAALNHIESKVRVIRQDAFLGLKELRQKEFKFDVIILDPPAFIKKKKDKKEGFIAYQRIHELALKLLNPGGILFSCSCSQHLSLEELLEAIQKAGERVKAHLQILETGTQAPDHPIHIAMPETNYLKMVIVRDVSDKKIREDG